MGLKLLTESIWIHNFFFSRSKESIIFLKVFLLLEYFDDKYLFSDSCFKNNSIKKLFFEAPTPENTIDSSKAAALILTHTLSSSSKSNV